MFGVLVVADESTGAIGYLAAYSGQIGGRSDQEGFVPAVFDYLQPDGYFKQHETEISRMQDMIDNSTNAREVAQATKRREKLTKQLKECREYDEKLAHLALSRIELDLDDGVKKNYRKIQTANDGKLYEVLADSKNIMSKE